MKIIRRPQEKDGSLKITPSLLKLVGVDSEFDAIEIVYTRNSLHIKVVECPECLLTMQWDSKSKICYCPRCNIELPREEKVGIQDGTRNFEVW